MDPVDLYPLFPKPLPTERHIIDARVRSYRKWARRKRLLQLYARLFGRRQVRTPAKRSCQPVRSSSVILRKVTSGTEKA